MTALVESGCSLGRQRLTARGGFATARFSDAENQTLAEWLGAGPKRESRALGARIQFPAFANELTPENCTDIF